MTTSLGLYGTDALLPEPMPWLPAVRARATRAPWVVTGEDDRGREVDEYFKDWPAQQEQSE